MAEGRGGEGERLWLKERRSCRDGYARMVRKMGCIVGSSRGTWLEVLSIWKGWEEMECSWSGGEGERGELEDWSGGDESGRLTMVASVQSRSRRRGEEETCELWECLVGGAGGLLAL